ncbi:SIS domain-containing protein [Candidatus Bipolaricaulota sp. J31]
MIKRFLEIVEELLSRVVEEEAEAMRKASELLFNVMKRDGIMHVVGAGHSAIVGEELFYRAGGMAIINPLLNSDINVSRGAERSTSLEGLAGYARILLEHAGVEPGDAVLVVSTSGVNVFPVEAALCAKELGAHTLGLTSVEYSMGLSARNSYGKRLFEVVDVVLDNKVPPGDAVLRVKGLEVPVAPVSTILNSFIVHSVIALTVERAVEAGMKPPIWLSAHLEGAREHNGELFRRYRPRVRLL